MKKMLIILFAFSILQGIAQSTDENLYKTTTMKTDAVTRGANNLNSTSSKDKIEELQYVDGLGRPKQTIAINAGGNQPLNNLVFWQSEWTLGANTTPFFNRNGSASENLIIEGSTPFSTTDRLWQCGSDVGSNADGGWNTDYFPVDKTQTYRYMVWVKRTGSQNGTTYHGTQNVNNLNGNANNNPYFWAGDLPQLNTWYLAVGIIHPHGYTGGNSGISGVYDLQGNKVLSGNDFKWRNTTTQSRFRSYLYYSTDLNTKQYFYNPIVEKDISLEQSISDAIKNQAPKQFVSHVEYDDLGRETKKHLPYSTDEGFDQKIQSDALNKTKSFYNSSTYDFTKNPFSETIYEKSPLNRIVEQAAPGEAWKYDKDNIEYINPVYEEQTIRPSNYDKSLHYLNLVSNNVRLGFTLSENAKLQVRNGQFTVDFTFHFRLGETTPLKTGVITTMDITPAISYADLGYVQMYSGGQLVNTVYKAHIDNNQLIITNTTSTPQQLNSMRMTKTVNVTRQEQVLLSYDDIQSKNHTIRYEYNTNKNSEVVKFSVGYDEESGNPKLEQNGFYSMGQLHVTTTKNENWQPLQDYENNYTTKEYKDKLGNIVLKRSYNNGISYDTYFTYDIFNNLSFVISPKVNINDNVSQTELDKLCYQYRYDDQNRLVEKKIPGKGWEYMVYNSLGQLVMKQDANMRRGNSGNGTDQWLFTKYDAIGRVVYTGIVNNNNSRQALQTAANDTNAYTLYEKRGEAINLAGTTLYYSNTTFPIEIEDIFTINYYDDYNFDKAGITPPSDVYGQSINNSVKSLSTGNKIRILGTDSWITRISYYDSKGRVIYLATNNEYLQTFDNKESKLDFIGRSLETKRTHRKGTNTPIVIIDQFTYDHLDRILQHKQKINGQEQDISQNTYDQLGQLVSKTVGGGLQQVNFSYNVRGWITSMNNDNNDDGDLFNFKLSYATPLYGGNAIYNGNISETIWKTASDNIERFYTYQYDNLNRLIDATDSANRYNLSDITYDKMGNILTLKRSGNLNAVATSFGLMDNLTYTYDYGNKLLKVTETGSKDYGFTSKYFGSSNQYEYDANGNMDVDLNKGISNISYNHINLPTNVEISNSQGTGNISYIYDATGTKQKKIVSAGGSLIETEYAGNYVYKDGNLQFFNHAEGYVEPENDGSYTYIYQYKDHLGNIRLSYADDNNNGSIEQGEIRQEKNYYPFGLEHKGYNNEVLGRPHFYGFGNKEKQNELGLGWIDVSARNYNPELGRWMNIDPLSEKYYLWSPYNYVYNNPLKFIDPTGKGPELPNLAATLKILKFNTYIFRAFFASNNTSNKQLFDWANGKNSGRNKVIGAIGEGLAGMRLNSSVGVSTKGISTGFGTGLTYGKRHNGRQVDIQQSIKAGYRRSIDGSKYKVTPSVTSFSFDGNSSRQVTYDDARGKFTANIEVKTLNPDGEVSNIYENLSKGIDQAISNGEGHQTVGILLTDQDAWQKVAGDKLYGKLLQKDYARLRNSGNHLRLEKDLYSDTNKAAHALKDNLKE